jgi:gamma-glutamyltranspeptidase/glutathione hydrolase
VAVVAADADGGFVSLIFSLFYSFGAGICDPATGVVLHNRGAGFTLDADSPNCLAPSRRPAHSLMPLLLGDDDGVFAAHGTMGGYGQPQIHTQLLLRLRAGQTPAEAVTAPRWVVGRPDDGGELEIDVERSAPAVAQDSLRDAGLPVRLLADLDSEVGHAQLVRRDDSGQLLVATDPRAEG